MSSNYTQIELNTVWFTGHNVSMRGIYQDQSSVKLSFHRLKILMQSPSFNEINVDFQYYRDNNEFRIDIKVSGLL